jgi:ATP-dependent helicase/nuclease subunit B
MAKAATCLYTLPASCSFGDELAKGLLARFDGKPEELAATRLLLPTRRACRTVQEAFLRQTGGKPLLLPMLQPLGDVDEVELDIRAAGMGEMHLTIPPAIAPLQRQVMLALMLRAAYKDDGDESFSHYFALAESLASLLDEMHTEGVELRRFDTLVARDDLRMHWELSLKFLKQLEDVWPKILEERRVADPAWRRRELMLALARQWEASPPQTPIIAAGTTGTIPATTRLLQVIAKLPQGEIILPGLDLELDTESWDALEEGHPQFTLKRLLQSLKTTRDAVFAWPHADCGENCVTALWRETMRPSQTSMEWQTPRDIDASCLETITLAEAETPEQEALVIALAMRDVLQRNDETAFLVTPDRMLAARVRECLSRWDIVLDDSAGSPLLETPQGLFLRSILRATNEDLSPLSTLALLRNALTRCGHDSHLWAHDLAEKLDGPDGYRHRNGINPKLPQELVALTELLAPLTTLNHGFHAPDELLAALLQVAEAVSDAAILWAGDAGEQLAQLFIDWEKAMGAMPRVTLTDFRALLLQLMEKISVRQSLAGAPRLRILGQLEARLQQADLMILSGLNEGTWPKDPAADPWLSRQMRKDLDLPLPERSITLAAHDFVQAASARNVLFTRSKNGADGNPTTPSRWLLRLDAVIEMQGLPDPRNKGEEWLRRAKLIDKPYTQKPLGEPKPCPPLSARPTQFNVSDIGIWVNDPYALYAKKVLQLICWPDIGEDLSLSLHGTHIHAIMKAYFDAMLSEPHTSPSVLLLRAAEKHGPPNDLDVVELAAWDGVITRLGAWLDAHEAERKQNGWQPLFAEIEGEGQIGSVTVKGRLDRIDRNIDGSIAIIDYKNRANNYTGDMGTGHRPQLAVEAVMAQNGYWNNVDAADVSQLQYWHLKGRDGATVQTPDNAKRPLDDIITAAKDGLAQLYDAYNRDAMQAYLSQPFGPKYAEPDYTYLSRVGEWSLNAEDDSGEEAA